jgi:hypothetical protein
VTAIARFGQCRRTLSIIVPVVLWACVGASDPPPLQLAADLSVPLEKAVEACGAIEDVRQRGRCTLEALKVRDAISSETCTNIPGHGLRGRGRSVDGRTLMGRGLGLGTSWHDECLFEAAARSPKPLRDRYEMCAEAGSFSRVCGYHLWQTQLNKLQVGKSGTETEALKKATALYVEHKPHAKRLDHNFTKTYWTWFWGSWWTQQGVSDANDQRACLQWSDPVDQETCRTWAPAARAWVDDREKNKPN